MIRQLRSQAGGVILSKPDVEPEITITETTTLQKKREISKVSAISLSSKERIIITITVNDKKGALRRFAFTHKPT